MALHAAADCLDMLNDSVTPAVVFETLRECADRVGAEIGVSDWTTITQERIDLFAKATGDFQWIHVDVERAAREMPGGKTIAHGFLTLSIIAEMIGQIYDVREVTKGLNYGLNRVRFLAPVPSGSRIRLRLGLKEAMPVESDGFRFVFACAVELEGSDKLACAAEVIALMYA